MTEPSQQSQAYGPRSVEADTLQGICEEYLRREGKRLRSLDWRRGVFNCPIHAFGTEQGCPCGPPRHVTPDPKLAHRSSEDRRREREREEIAQWHTEGLDPRAAYQRELDRWWEQKLAVEAEIRAMRASGEIPERGVYDPMKRFEREVKEGG